MTAGSMAHPNLQCMDLYKYPMFLETLEVARV